jgi:hypothetical protein
MQDLACASKWNPHASLFIVIFGTYMEHFMTERRSEIARKTLEEKIYINDIELKPWRKTDK